MKRAISILVSLAILGLIYWRIDISSLWGVFRGCDVWWLTIGLGMFVPITLATAYRLKLIMPRSVICGLWESTKLILAASVLNLVLPSKMGDIAKAWFMRDSLGMPGSSAFAVVVFEKSCDMLSLLLWCAFGLAVFPKESPLFWPLFALVAAGLVGGITFLGSRRFSRALLGWALAVAPGKLHGKIRQLQESWADVQTYTRSSPARMWFIGMGSVAIWFLHLLQIWFFIFALRQSVPMVTNMALSSLSILAGLAPLTFAGVGTRDAALILFYSPYFPAATGAALGLLCTSRYLLPALVGLPFAPAYFAGFGGRKSERIAE